MCSSPALVHLYDNVFTPPQRNALSESADVTTRPDFLEKYQNKQGFFKQ